MLASIVAASDNVAVACHAFLSTFAVVSRPVRTLRRCFEEAGSSATSSFRKVGFLASLLYSLLPLTW